MRPHQTPTLFVAILLEPDQFGLFEEIEVEAIDILDVERSTSFDRISEKKTLVLIDHDNTRLALGWFRSPMGDTLSIAVGARPGHVMPENDARHAADMARELVTRAEALFAARRAQWQIALLPLNIDAMESHAMQIDTFDPADSYQAGSPFMTVKPDAKAAAPKPQRVPASIAHLDPTADPRSDLSKTEVDTNWTKQASALALSTTFVLVTPPVGFAMLAYAALRQGKDMDLLPQSLDMPQVSTQKVFAVPKRSYG